MQENNARVFILHGWSLDPKLKDRWQPLIKLLSKNGLRVEYLPLPGFDIPLKKSWSLSQFEEYVLQKIKGCKKVVLLGHSFGGQLAVKVAAAQPKNLEALVLIAPAGIIDRSLCKRLKRSVFKILAKLGSGLLRAFGQSDQSAIYRFTQKKLHFAARESDYLQSPKKLKLTMQNILKDEIEDDLPQIQTPTLIFWGDLDSFTPVKHAAVFTSKIPTAQLKLLRKEGHRPYFTQPKLLAENIISFIEKNVS